MAYDERTRTRPDPRPHGLHPVRVVLLVLALLAGGCAYSFYGASVPKHIHTIAVPTFENRTLQPGLEQDITNEVIDVFLGDSRLNLGQPGDADAVVEGVITRYDHSVFGLGQGDTVEEYRVTIEATITVKDRVKGKDLWTQTNLLGQASYRLDAPGAGPTDETSAREAAVTELADKVLSNTLEDW
jgi:hypothetical protein